MKDVERKMVHVPNFEHVVIVYDQKQDDEYVNVKFPEYYAEEGASYKEHWNEELKMIITCKIPEIGFEIHTRRFACRVDENGVLQSLENGYEEAFIHNFPIN
ncbi:MAG: hypothetical protein PUF50_03965 [Erysipelotrichaceae bacterium]|nr:hypothetical protein [Erysipelotrichaceae bacterium]